MLPTGVAWRRVGLGYTMAAIFLEGMMARKDRLTRVAVGIGTAMGKADRKGHQGAAAGLGGKKELEEIGKQVEGLKRQLEKTTTRLKGALREEIGGGERVHGVVVGG